MPTETTDILDKLLGVLTQLNTQVAALQGRHVDLAARVNALERDTGERTALHAAYDELNGEYAGSE